MQQVRAINGAEVRNLKALVEAAEACTDKYIKLDMDYNQVGCRGCHQMHGVCMPWPDGGPD